MTQRLDAIPFRTIGLLAGAAAALVVACSDGEDANDSADTDGGKHKTDTGISSSEGDAAIADGSVGDGETTVDEGGTLPDGGPSTVNPVKLPAKERSWTWYDIPGAVCRDGSNAGFALNVNSLASSSKKLMVFFQGGGACFESNTCANNPAKVSAKSVSGGIVDRSNAANPVADWDYAFVPYCTGDVHVGNNPNGNVPGVGPQKFVGYVNTALFLKTLKATFPATQRVLMTGTSGGGFGSAGNYMQAVREFPGIPVNLADDSGQLMRSPALAQCLQATWKSLWGLEKSLIAECGADCTSDPDYLLAASKHAAKTYSKYAQGLITATGDTTIRQFYGFGESGCTTYKAVTEEAFKAGVLDIRAQHASYSNFGVYAYDSTKHTLLLSGSYYTANGTSKTVASWVGDIVTDKAANIGP